MIVAIQALQVLLPVLYALCAILHGMAFGGERAPKVGAPRRSLLRITLVVHALVFVLRGLEIHQFPIDDLWTTVSAIAFSTALLHAAIARTAGHAGSGGVVLGLVFVFQLFASAFGAFVPHARPGGMGPWQISHVATSCIASAALVLSGVHGVLYLILFREMRERRFGALFGHLPDLDLLAKMTRRAALVGFIGLLIGLNVGIALAHAEKIPGFDYTHPEVLFSLVLWVYFGVIAFSQKIPGFSARRASYAAAGGLVALLLSILLVLLPHSFHSAL
jgi:ABC-type uncharacterized transport system permease subunit